MIAKYGTNKRLNKSKATWGTCSYLPDDKDMWIEFDKQTYEKIKKDSFFEQYGIYPRDILNFDILNRFCVFTQDNHFMADGITANLIENKIINLWDMGLENRIALFTNKSWKIENGKKEREYGWKFVERTNISDEEINELFIKFNSQNFVEIYENGYKDGR